MAREVFGSKFFGGEEEKTIKNIERGRREAPGSEPHAWWEDWEEEKRDLEASYDEAARHYEEALSIPPPEDWTAEDIVEALDKEAIREKNKRGWPKQWEIKRGHRKGLKPEKRREAA